MFDESIRVLTNEIEKYAEIVKQTGIDRDNDNYKWFVGLCQLRAIFLDNKWKWENE